VAKASVCIEMLLTELDLYERPAAAARLGFEAVEIWGTAEKDVRMLREACDRAGVAVACFLGPAGLQMSEDNPPHAAQEAMKRAADTAHALGASTMIVTVGNTMEGVPRSVQTDRIVKNLQAMAPVAEDRGIKLAVEALNTLVDHPGYFLDHTADARAIVDRVGSPAVGMLYDIYHMQVMEGNLIETIRRNIDVIWHVHVADVPGRMEPGTGEINYPNVLRALDEAGYQGYCGLEFKPSDNSQAALKRAKEAFGPA